jgi:hypothetical protein
MTQSVVGTLASMQVIMMMLEKFKQPFKQVYDFKSQKNLFTFSFSPEDRSCFVDESIDDKAWRSLGNYHVRGFLPVGTLF